jgi:hypothetical protein
VKRPGPPALATWFLAHLGCGSAIEPLVGDLVEEFRAGRSRWWFWRQTAAAIAISFGEDLRAHWALGVRALSVGCGAVFLFGWLIADPVFDRATRAALEHGLVSVGALSQYNVPASMLLGSIGFAASARLVSRLHRPHQTAMVLLFLCLVLVLQLPRLCELVVDALGHPRYLPYLSGHVAGTLVTVFSTLVGGLWRSASRPAPSAPGSTDRASATS